ncbi:dihydrolipoamide acetyltransferase family protein [Nocardia cyriacigeorgica]|uniref:dihydrolipoamide acetyltransferase family protein n=1 Tax=Nocardia cyriacigeorgica TaxID=135487 RepID=UPI0024566E1A|nr:dihydrolipoamide acetyltransferase family protein [Nocardia cyriacigeorgica]
MNEPRADDPNHVLEFRLPDLGEGLTDAELQSWSVAVGDIVELNQTIAEVETAKAVVALPSPFAGTVVQLLAEPGETVPVGAPLIRVRTTAPATPEAPAVTPDSTQARSSAPERTSVLVGYGPEAEAVSRRRRPVESADGAQPRPEAVASSAANGKQTAGARAAATPAARKLAKELGIDLWYVAGSGPQGAVTVDDVRSAVPVSSPRVRAAAPAAAPATPETPAGAESGVVRPPAREERTPISGVRKRTAAAMVASARTIPQAGASVTVDCTATMELLDHLRTTAPFTGLTLTPLALVAKSVLAALAEYPGLNAYWDEANQEIVTKHYVNLGIAVATDRGLLVPNIKDAHALSLRDLCREIGWLVEVARTGNAAPTDLRGGTFTISNVGVFGVDAGMPLVNPGEAAILCLGAITKRPWVVRDELAIRWVTTLTLSFDHRMIDGEQAAKFLATTAGLLEDPLTLLSRL